MFGLVGVVLLLVIEDEVVDLIVCFCEWIVIEEGIDVVFELKLVCGDV